MQKSIYFAMQSVGLCKGGVKPFTIAYTWKTAGQPILSYTAQRFSVSNKAIQEVERTQARLLKAALVINKYYRTTQLLVALKIQKISTLINFIVWILLSHILKENKTTFKLFIHLY